MTIKDVFKPDKLKVLVSLAFLVAGVFAGKFYVLNVLVLSSIESLGFGAFLISLVLDFAVVYIVVCVVITIIRKLTKSGMGAKNSEQGIR
jgi:uncharacterized membrane protein